MQDQTPHVELNVETLKAAIEVRNETISRAVIALTTAPIPERDRLDELNAQFRDAYNERTWLQGRLREEERLIRIAEGSRPSDDQ